MINLKKILSNKLISYADEPSTSISEYKYILALSGGVDSMTLFQCLIDLNLNFYTVYFNHNYHAESNNVSTFLEELTFNSNVIKHFKISLDLSNAKNFESKSRDKRYFHLENLRRRLNCNLILTAHHLDDQIETLHMRKIQNAHWSNSLGIREKLNNIHRPLLSISKETIIEFATRQQLVWKEDPTNSDNSFLRNRIRNIDLPELKIERPEYVYGLLSQYRINIDKFEEISQMIKKTNFNTEQLTFGISLKYDKLSLFTSIGKKVVLQYFIKNYFQGISLSHSWDEWKNLLTYLESKVKRKSLFKLSEDISVYKSASKIFMIRHNELAFTEVLLENGCEWHGGKIVLSPQNKFKAYSDKLNASLPLGAKYMVRQWKASDSYVSATSGHRRKVSDLFIDNKLNYIQKKIQPIVIDENDTILWIPGLAHASVDMNRNFTKYTWESHLC